MAKQDSKHPLDPYFFTMKDGTEYCNEEECLAKLLFDGILFCNTGKFNGEDTVVLFILCNDLFYWGTADGQAFTTVDIGPLMKMHLEDPDWGAQKWCCLKRNLRPQVPVIEFMKKQGKWTPELEALPAPPPS